MSTTYKQAWVDIDTWDKASALAYNLAKTTFSSRKWKIWCPAVINWGFAGLLDFWDYYLTQCCDTVWTKIDLSEKIWDFSGLWYDLLAMVADDAICLWAEVVSISNTFETKKIETSRIEEMMKSLAAACKEQEIVISGWEIAEIWDLTNWTWWWADAIWIVEKDKVILWDKIEIWDTIISLQETSFRCNWYSLIRKILKDNFWENFYSQKITRDCVSPSTIYHKSLLDLIWRYWEKSKFNIKAISHITWWGLPWNINRVLKKWKTWAILDNLFSPSKSMIALQKMWNVSDLESYKTWNMWNWMMLICKPEESEVIIKNLKESWINAQIAWQIIQNPIIKLVSKWYFSAWNIFEFNI